jgi:hypothetical protein
MSVTNKPYPPIRFPLKGKLSSLILHVFVDNLPSVAWPILGSRKEKTINSRVLS